MQLVQKKGEPMNNTSLFKTWVLFFTFLVAMTLLVIFAEPISGQEVFKVNFPLIMKPGSLAEQLKEAVNEVLLANESELSVNSVMYNSFTMTIDFSAPTEVDLIIDSMEFEDQLKDINLAVTNVLENDGYPSPHNFDYELFINGQTISSGLNSDVNTDPSSGRTGTLVALSPGHGWAVSGNGWRLDRGYHNGIVEDFINSELVLQLNQNLLNAGVQTYPTRELSRSVGNHSSGYPWWQMGSSEFARNLGFPGLVWGQ